MAFNKFRKRNDHLSQLLNNQLNGKSCFDFNPMYLCSCGLKILISNMKEKKNVSSIKSSNKNDHFKNVNANDMQTKDSNLLLDFDVNLKSHKLQSTSLIRRRFKVIELIGNGTFSRLVKVKDLFSSKEFALKIMNKKHNAIGIQESNILRRLNENDNEDIYGIVRMFDCFIFDGNVCLRMELLGENLVSAKKTLFERAPPKIRISSIRKVSIQLLSTLHFLRKQKLIHADIKPENILFVHQPFSLNESGGKIWKERESTQYDELELGGGGSLKVKIIDFGNSFYESQANAYFSTFDLQSGFYKSPEVVFGVKFDCSIDIFSLGCVLAELFLGFPLFYVNPISFTSSHLINSQLYLKWISNLGPVDEEFENRNVPLFFHLFSAQNQQQTNSSKTINISNIQKIMREGRDCYFVEMLLRMLEYDKNNRISPSQCLSLRFFGTAFSVQTSYQQHQTVLNSTYHYLFSKRKLLGGSDNGHKKYIHSPKLLQIPKDGEQSTPSSTPSSIGSAPWTTSSTSSAPSTAASTSYASTASASSAPSTTTSIEKKDREIGKSSNELPNKRNREENVVQPSPSKKIMIIAPSSLINKTSINDIPHSNNSVNNIQFSINSNNKATSMINQNKVNVSTNDEIDFL
jgi:serine/threonine protein kinase